MRVINEEFKSDDLFIGKINIIRKQAIEKFDFSSSDCIRVENVIALTLLAYEAKIFWLVPNQLIKMHSDDRIDINVKISHILNIIQANDDLFKYLCERRLREVLNVDIKESRNLGSDYKLEKDNLKKMATFEDFNALFCKILDFRDSISESLFAYLANLESLIEELDENEEEKHARLKIVKDLYDKVLFKSIRAEQQRRNKAKANHSEESLEEIFLKKLIGEREEEMNMLSQEINKCQEDIDNDQNLISQLLLEKENAREEYKERLDKLLDIAKDLRASINATQEKINELRSKEAENQERISEAQEELIRLEAALREIEREIEDKQLEKELLENEIENICKSQKKLKADLERVNFEKARKEEEKAMRDQEINVGNDAMQLIKNFQKIFAYAQVQSRKEKISKIVGNAFSLKDLLDELQKVFEDLKVWSEMIENINFYQFSEYISNRERKIAGETQLDFMKRLKSVIRSCSNFECELATELVNGKPVKKFKLTATNVSYVEVHKKVREKVEKEMQSNEACSGLSFENDLLRSSPYGIKKGIPDLPDNLRQLVERRIELHYQSELVEAKKNAQFGEAAKIINCLNISYKDVVGCWVEEIEIVVSGKFILEKSESYPGIDLTINTVDMECVGENLTIDTSGRNGLSYVNKASDGNKKR